MTSSNPKRRSRLEPTKRQKPLRESKWVIEALSWIHDLRWATNDQLQLTMGLHRSTLQSHLRNLLDAEMVKTQPVIRATIGMGGSPKLVYKLTAKGKDVLARHLGISDFSAVPIGNLSPYFAPHIMAINDVRALTYRGCLMNNWRIGTWLDERTIRADYDTVTITVPTAKMNKTYSVQIPIVPDAHFTLNMGEGGEAFFMLEVDRGTESTKTFQKKVFGYLEYIRNGGFERRFHHGAFRVITVVDMVYPR